MSAFNEIKRAKRQAIKAASKAVGIQVTYTWLDESVNPPVTHDITGVWMRPSSKSFRHNLGDMGVVDSRSNLFTVNQNALVYSGSVVQPTHRDYINDGTHIWQIEDIQSDSFEGVWKFVVRKMSVERGTKGTVLIEGL